MSEGGRGDDSLPTRPRFSAFGWRRLLAWGGRRRCASPSSLWAAPSKRPLLNRSDPPGPTIRSGMLAERGPVTQLGQSSRTRSICGRQSLLREHLASRHAVVCQLSATDWEGQRLANISARSRRFLGVVGLPRLAMPALLRWRMVKVTPSACCCTMPEWRRTQAKRDRQTISAMNLLLRAPCNSEILPRARVKLLLNLLVLELCANFLSMSQRCLNIVCPANAAGCY